MQLGVMYYSVAGQLVEQWWVTESFSALSAATSAGFALLDPRCQGTGDGMARGRARLEASSQAGRAGDGRGGRRSLGGGISRTLTSSDGSASPGWGVPVPRLQLSCGKAGSGGGQRRPPSPRESAGLF